MKLKLNKQTIISLNNVCSWYYMVKFNEPLVTAMIAEQAGQLYQSTGAKLKTMRVTASIEVTYAQCLMLQFVCGNLSKEYDGHPQIVLVEVIEPVLKSLLEPNHTHI